MARNKFIICLSTLLLLLASCDANSNNTSPKEGKSAKQTEVGNTENGAGKDSMVIPAQTANDSSQKKANASQIGSQEQGKSPRLDTSTILLYISLGCSILSLLLIIVVLIAMTKIPNWVRTEKFKNYIIDRVISDSYKNTGRIFNLIDNHGKKTNYQQNVSDRNIEAIVNRTIERNIDVIVDRVMVCIKLDRNEANMRFKSQGGESLTQQQSVSNPSHIYASSADSDRNSFFKTTSQPDEDTIYKLSLSGGSARFVVYDGAFKKVLKAPDFLECACEVQSLGNQTVTTAEPGTAEKQADGTWKITSKANVKFE